MSTYHKDLLDAISSAISMHSIYSREQVSWLIEKLGSVDKAMTIIDESAKAGIEPFSAIEELLDNSKTSLSEEVLELSALFGSVAVAVIDSAAAENELESQSFSLWDIFIPPFKYEHLGQDIWDDAGHLIANIRSWGYLTGMGALGLPEKKAAEIQDHFGRWIAAALTDCAISDRNGDNMPNSAAE